MDAKWARQLIERVCADLARKRRKLGPVGVGLTMTIAGAGITCGSEDLYGMPADEEVLETTADSDDDDSTPSDLYGMPGEVEDGDEVEDEMIMNDVYGVPNEIEDEPIASDAYGVPDSVD